MHTMRMVLVVILTMVGVGMIATPAIGGGARIPIPDTQIGMALYYNGGTWKIESLRDQVVAATITAANARFALMAKIKGDFEPILAKILNGNVVTPPAQNNRTISRSWSPAPTPVTSIVRKQSMQVARNSPQNLISGVMSRGITSRVITPLPQVTLDELRQNFLTATDNQKKLFDQYSSLVVKALKAEGQYSGNISNLYDYSNYHVKVLTIMSPLVWDYFTTLFTLAVNQPLVGCNVDLVGKQLLRTASADISDVVKFNDSLHCLFPTNIKKVDRALSSAFTMTMKVVSTLQPAYAPTVQGDLLLRLGPVLLNVFDVTKTNDSILYPVLVKYVAIATGQSSYKAPIYMKSNYVDSWNQITLYNSKSKKTVVTPLCDFSLWDEFVAKNPGVQWVETKNLPVISTGVGPKTRWGVLQTQVDSTALTLKSKPYPVTYTAAFGNKGAECVLDATDFLTLAVHPVLLGDGHCSYWESTRNGLGCGGKKFIPGVSASSAAIVEGITRVAKVIEEWLMPSAWAETPTGPCEELKKLEDMLFCADKVPSDKLKSCIITYSTPECGFSSKKSKAYSDCVQLLTLQCQSKPVDPPQTPAQKDAQQCFDDCDDNKNIPVCAELQNYFDQIIKPGGCFLKTAAFVGGEKVCDAGTPCTCEFTFYWQDCQDASNVCLSQCRKQFGPNPKKVALGNQMCDDWNGMGGLDWWNYMKEGTQIDNGILDAILQLSPEHAKMIKAFKDDGAVVFEKYANIVIDWLEYYTGVKFDEGRKQAAIKDSLYDLAKAQPCPGNNPEASVAQQSMEGICWFPQMVGYTNKEAGLTGAHEAIHALEEYLLWDKPGILDLAVQHAKEDAMQQDADWYAYMKDDAGFLSHWVLKVLNNQISIINPGYANAGNDKDAICN